VSESGKTQAETEAALKAEEFKAIALPHIESIYRSALRMVGNVSDAQDLVQDSYLRAYRFFDKFKKGTNIKAWLLKILRNLWINKYHKELRAPKMVDIRDIETSEAVKAAETPEDRIFDGLLDDDITCAIDSLPEYFRLAVTLSDLEGLSYREIAEIMDCPVGTVMSRLYRGRKLLRESLHDYARRLGYVKY
jgi:RNA polymerase sigma-70 factor (ECF subfamily)